MKLIIYIIILSLYGSVRAQPYIQSKTRHRFAQLNLGLDSRYFIPAGNKISTGSSPGDQDISGGSETRLIIGGTHFWGHADFFIAVPVIKLHESGFGTGVETGAKLFPWTIQSGKTRTYLSASFLPVHFKKGDGPQNTRLKTSLGAGLVFNYKNHLLDLGVGYIPGNLDWYYYQADLSKKISLPEVYIGLGYKLMIETTLSAEKRWLSGETKRLTDTLQKLKRLDGFTIAVGPSSAFYLNPGRKIESRPFTGKHKATGVFPEFAAGYYLHAPDVQLNFAYRNIKSRISAYGYSEIADRRAFTLEAYKFFGDYHGFAPFIGPALSYDRLNLSAESPNGNTSTDNYDKWSPGIIFGWDIRPDRLQIFYLRTNIRWFPDLGSKTFSLSFNQLEVNFIQLVLFPGRMF